jgi:hypothetical protein
MKDMVFEDTLMTFLEAFITTSRIEEHVEPALSELEILNILS